ncbi:MAG TPA: hypothetical protein VHV83_11275 [Armatimonadota bacterium]|nr:hypothetical protein [Armatimonadota bacterium]
MNILRWYTVFLIIFPLLISMGGCTAAAKEPGGATPAEVLTQLKNAIQAVDVNEIALCQSAYVRDNPNAARTLANMHRLSPVSKQLIIDGVKKYGVTNFVNALDVYGLVNISQGADNIEISYNLFLSKGTLDITGNKAVYRYKVSKNGDEILSKQPEIAQFQKAMLGSATMTELTATFVKLNDRWFCDSPDSKAIAYYGKIYQPFSEYQQQVRQCLDASKDITAFKAALAKPSAKFEQAVTNAKSLLK